MSRTINANQCQQWVYSGNRLDCAGHQCNRKPVKDGFCNVHHPHAVAQRDAEKQERWREKLRNSPWHMLWEATKRIAELESEIAMLHKMLSKDKVVGK